jgi:hypothetical protein
MREIVFASKLDVKATRDAWTPELNGSVMRAAARMRGKYFFMGLPFVAEPRGWGFVITDHTIFGGFRHGILTENQMLFLQDPGSREIVVACFHW